MSAKSETHRGQQFVGIVGFTARAEALVQRGGEHRSRHGFVDCRFDRPSAFAGVRHPSGKLRKARILDQGSRREVQEPGCYYTASPPHFGDVLEVQVVLVMLRVAQGRGLSVNLALLPLSYIGGVQHGQTFGIGRHDSVLDAVVNHLDEMAGAVGTAVQVALFGGAIEFFATGRARYVTDTGGKRREDWIEVLNHVLFAANHHAITTFEAPHTATGAYVHVVNLLSCELPGALDVVNVIRIAAVDENVACLQMR